MENETILEKLSNFVLAKKYRLTEKNTKRVLHKWKPFFSYGIVLNLEKNKYNHNRFAIVIWSKSVISSVHRNYFRRRFYDLMKDKLDYKAWIDMVFVVKQKTKLNLNDKNSINSFVKDLNFLLNKI